MRIRPVVLLLPSLAACSSTPPLLEPVSPACQRAYDHAVRQAPVVGDRSFQRAALRADISPQCREELRAKGR